MKKQRVRAIYLLLGMILMLALTACHVPDPKLEGNNALDDVNRDIGEEVESREEQEEFLMEEFYKLLKEPRNKDGLVEFLDENISKLSIANASLMIVSLEEYLEDSNYNFEESYILLNKYKQYVSLEIKSYLSILFTEASRPFKNDKNINIDLEELLGRIKMAEDHITIFARGDTRENIEALYKDYIKGLIVGSGDRSSLTESDSSLIKEELIDLYRSAVREKERKGISNILREYLIILERNNGDLDSDEVKDFHSDLDKIIINEIDE